MACVRQGPGSSLPSDLLLARELLFLAYFCISLFTSFDPFSLQEDLRAGSGSVFFAFVC